MNPSPPNPTQPEVPTPETDAAIVEFEYSFAGYGGEMLGGTKEMIEPDFARHLERALAVANAQIDGLRQQLWSETQRADKAELAHETDTGQLAADVARVTRERDEAKDYLHQIGHGGETIMGQVLSLANELDDELDSNRTLRAELTRARDTDIERGGIMGRIAIALFPGHDNVTDEQCVTGVQAMALELAQLKKAGEQFDADIVELFAKCQRGEMTCIYAAQVVEGKTATVAAENHRLAALVEGAPHAAGCAILSVRGDFDCNCFKSRAKTGTEEGR